MKHLHMLTKDTIIAFLGISLSSSHQTLFLAGKQAEGVA